MREQAPTLSRHRFEFTSPGAGRLVVLWRSYRHTLAAGEVGAHLGAGVQPVRESVLLAQPLQPLPFLPLWSGAHGDP